MKPTLDSRQLLAFAALAWRGSFTLAAKDLFLTQSAVSHTIKALESDLGTRLLDRVGRRVVLTQPGEQFLRHTEKILREMEAARAGLEALTTWGHGRLRVGASTTACKSSFLAMVRRDGSCLFPVGGEKIPRKRPDFRLTEAATYSPYIHVCRHRQSIPVGKLPGPAAAPIVSVEIQDGHAGVDHRRIQRARRRDHARRMKAFAALAGSCPELPELAANVASNARRDWE